MSKNFLRISGLALLSLYTCATGFADSKVKARYTSGGQSNETTIYTKGARQRLEYGTQMSAVTQCDLKRIVQITDSSKSYVVMPLGGVPSTSPSQATSPTRGGVVTCTTTVADTGERQPLFGYTAKHLKIVSVKEASPSACDQKKERIETDGWYIDFQGAISCSVQPISGKPGRSSECGDEIRYNLKSKEQQGFPLRYTATTYKEDGTVAATLTMETLEFSDAPLEAALFEIPAGYTELSLQQMSAQNVGASDGRGATPSQGLTGEPTGPKQAGTIRIGVANVATRVGKPASTQPLKDQLRGFMGEAGIDTVSLSATSIEQMNSEGRQEECDYVLQTDVAELKKGKSGGFGGLMGKVSTMGGMTGEQPKEKFEAKTEYKLFVSGSTTPKLAASATGKTGGGFSLKTAMSLASTAGSVASVVSKK